MTNAVKTPLEMFYHWERTTPDKVFLRQPSKGVWTEQSWFEVGQKMRRLAGFIAGLELPPRSRIAIWSGNSDDWFIVDLAIMLSGHISVPLFGGQEAKSARYILEHTGCRLIFLGGFDRADQADAAIPEGITRVAMSGCTVNCQITLSTAIELSEPVAASPLPDSEDVFTIIYTSGSTGLPKGVMHSFGTAGRVVPKMIAYMGQIEGAARFMSYLPLAHIVERVLIELTSLYVNGTVSFSEGLASFGDELRSVQPTMFFSVPRLWGKFKEAVQAKIAPATPAHLNDAQKMAMRHRLGLAAATFIATGSAPCPKDVHQWFLDLGVALRDGYGATENFIDATVWNRDGQPVPGCVGTPMGDTAVRISDDGEVLLRCDGLMTGYYRDPEKTAEVMGDGWYRTGDSGRLDADGNLWLGGRIGDVFKTTKGKFVDPNTLESLWSGHPAFAQFCVFGQGLEQPVLVATLSELGRTQARTELARWLNESLAALNEDLSPHCVIKLILVAAEDWTAGNGLLTPTLKIRRKAVEARYREQVANRTGEERVVFE